jgi:GT2 family glycosyltransferase
MRGVVGDPAGVDLVLATIGRTSELQRFLESLEAQSWRGFRVIVVDQNEDDRLDALLGVFEPTLRVLHLRSRPGLSRARNVALAHLEGELVGFPDDDCRYPPGLLAEVVERFRAHPEWDGISGRSVADDGRATNIRWDGEAGEIDRFNVWRRVTSCTMFMRRPVVDRIGGFAEELGAGSGTQWGSGEETDYVLRALEAGCSLHYDPALGILHEDPDTASNGGAAGKAYRYGLGQGRLLRLHGYPWWFAAHRVGYLVAGSAFFLATARPSRARFYLAMALGRSRGWLRPT